MSSSYIVPTIEWNGDADEIRVERVYASYKRETLKHRPEVQASRFSQTTEPKDARAYVDVDEFRLYKLAYRINDRNLVEVNVYVHDAWMKDLKGDERRDFVVKWVEARAAWYFSYGERKKIPFPYNPWQRVMREVRED